MKKERKVIIIIITIIFIMAVCTTMVEVEWWHHNKIIIINIGAAVDTFRPSGNNYTMRIKWWYNVVGTMVVLILATKG